MSTLKLDVGPGLRRDDGGGEDAVDEGGIEVAVVDLGNGHLADVQAEPGAAQFFGELHGEDVDTGERWRMAFSLPRSAVLDLSVWGES